MMELALGSLRVSIFRVGGRGVGVGSIVWERPHSLGRMDWAGGV